jgi:hypothetical protein
MTLIPLRLLPCFPLHADSAIQRTELIISPPNDQLDDHLVRAHLAAAFTAFEAGKTGATKP